MAFFIVISLASTPILLTSAKNNLFAEHQTIRGFVRFSDGSNVPNGIPVRITNLNNGQYYIDSTQQSNQGPGYYFMDVYDIGANDGDIVKANVSYGGCEGSNSIIVNISGPPQWCNVTIYGNLPPDIPSQPSGPTSGYVGISYNYSTNATDPDGDNVYYWFNWDDGNNSGWVGPYSSGSIGTASHIWITAGTYQVKVKAKDIYGAELGICWSDSLNVTIFPINNPPNTPSSPDPEDGETDVDVDYDLSWTGGDPDTGDTVTYDVYFEKNDPAPDVLVSNNQSGTTYNPGTMDGNTQYYWQIVAWDNHGAYAEGPVWDFTTENNPPNTPSDPNPEDGATDVDVNSYLSWNCSDPDEDNLTYNVYFEKNDPTPDVLVSNNQSGNTYDPGTMDYNSHYYWKIVAWDEYDSSTNGPIWDFTTGSEPNDPPYPPSDPNPEDGATNVDVNSDLSWNCSDPDGDDLTYDVYLEANDPTPDVLVSDDQTGTTFDPGTFDYGTTYYWKIIAKDSHSATTEGPIWYFTTEETPVPDLDCGGSLSWTGVKPGATVSGSFTVENIGDPNSLLDWEIESHPNWGTSWTFDPENGEDLTPEDDPVTVNVEVVAPNQQNSNFAGELKIVNSDNSSDFCIIPVYLSTPVNFQLTSSHSIKTNTKFSKNTHSSIQVLSINTKSTVLTNALIS